MFSRLSRTLVLISFISSLCFFSSLFNFQSSAQSLIEEREALEKELQKLEEEIAQYERDITKTQQEKKSLQNEIYILRQKINKLDSQIYRNNLIIKDLSLQIQDTQNSINQTSLKISQIQENLGNILQLRYEEDQRTLVEIFLVEESLSGFFDNLMALEVLNLKTQELLNNVKNLKTNLENQKKEMDQEKENLERMVIIQTLQKQEQQKTKQEQEYLLRLTESQYQQYLQKKQKAEEKAAEIRARIFELIGVPEAPTFGEALDLAKYVQSITGVRPAFLLAVLTQESNIGKNVGQCYLKNPTTGEGVVAFNGKKVSRVMKPNRDVPYFLAITKKLGRDPYNTLVSCPMSYGWGGAMGPAQFIPSTWVRYEERISKITGKPADPWNIKDAFLAAGLYLADYGAAKGTETAEWKAAMIYFSGTTRRTRYNGYGFYGDSVMNLAAKYQSDIEVLEAAK